MCSCIGENATEVAFTLIAHVPWSSVLSYDKLSYICCMRFLLRIICAKPKTHGDWGDRYTQETQKETKMELGGGRRNRASCIDSRTPLLREAVWGKRVETIRWRFGRCTTKSPCDPERSPYAIRGSVLLNRRVLSRLSRKWQIVIRNNDNI